MPSIWTEILNMPPEVLVISGVFAVIGTILLASFAGLDGGVNVVLSLMLLFAGGVAANWLSANIEVPLEDSTEKALLASSAGTVLSAIVALLIMPRHR